MKEVNIILNESLNARSFDESNMIHQLEFEKVKKLIAKQIAEADLSHAEVHHTISIFGERGTGKTSFLESVLQYYSNNSVDSQTCVLDLIDPTMIEEKGHVFLLIVSLINQKVRDALCGHSANPEKKAFLTDWECAMNKLAKGIPSLDRVGETFENTSWADDTFIMRRGLESVHSAFQLSRHFNECIKLALDILDKKAFLIAFDDIDVDFRKGWPVLETIRKYLCTPRIITLLSGDLHLYSINVRKQQWYNFGKALLKNEYDGCEYNKGQYTHLVDEMENQYMLKLFKAENRVKLFTVDEALRRSDIDYKINGIDIQTCYETLLKNWGINDKKHVIIYKNFLMNLPIRSQIHLVQSNMNEELKDIHSYDAFLSQMLSANIDVDLVSHSYEMTTVVILRYLINSNMLEGAYQLLPRYESTTINSCLMGLFLMWCNCAKNKSSLIFDYLMRIGFIRCFAEIMMSDSGKDARLLHLCRQSGVFQTNTLKGMFGNAMAYLYNEENLFSTGIFFPIRGLSGRAKNTNADALDFVFKNKSEIEKKLAYIPAVMLSFVHKNESRLYYSVYSILSAIGDLLRAKELGNDVITTFNEVSLLRSYQVSDNVLIPNDNENDDLQEEGNEVAEDRTDSFKEELDAWVDSVRNIFEAPFVIGKITTRFYYSQGNIYKSLKEEKDDNNHVRKVQLGRITSLSLLEFLNATLIEEAFVNYAIVDKNEDSQSIDGLNLNNVRTSGTVFENNLKFIYDNGASEAIPLTNALIKCPLIYPFIDNESVARLKEIMGLEEGVMNINVYEYLNRVTLKSQMR